MHTHNIRAALVVPVVVAALLVGGCGSSSSSKTSASSYVKGVCTSIGSWVKSVQARSTALTSTNPTTPAQGKQEFVTFMNEVVSDTDQALTGLKAAGVPNVNNGSQVANAVLGAMTSAKTILVDAQSKAQQLPTNDRTAFANQTKSLGTSVQTSLSKIGAGLSSLKSADLEKAAAKEPSCQSL
jgi:ABC-type glycerol-3-phosphate transport system substrate-binding protein